MWATSGLAARQTGGRNAAQLVNAKPSQGEAAQSTG